MDKILIAESLEFILNDSCPPFPRHNSTKNVRECIMHVLDKLFEE